MLTVRRHGGGCKSCAMAKAHSRSKPFGSKEISDQVRKWEENPPKTTQTSESDPTVSHWLLRDPHPPTPSETKLHTMRDVVLSSASNAPSVSMERCESAPDRRDSSCLTSPDRGPPVVASKKLHPPLSRSKYVTTDLCLPVARAAAGEPVDNAFSFDHIPSCDWIFSGAGSSSVNGVSSFGTIFSSNSICSCDGIFSIGGTFSVKGSLSALLILEVS